MLLYVLLIGLYVVLMSGFLFWVIRRRRKIVEEIQREFSGETVLASTPKANYFGQQSAGMLRVRGNGILLLTPKELHFRMYAPDRRWNIPVSALQSIQTPRSFFGKTIFRPLLQINYLGDDGQPDALCFAVHHVERWVESLEALLRRT